MSDGVEPGDAQTLVHAVVECLTPGTIPVFLTDGLRAYFDALNVSAICCPTGHGSSSPALFARRQWVSP